MSKETDGLDELLCWNVKRAERAEEQVAQLKQELKVKDKALELYQIIFKFNNGSRSTKEVLEAVRHIEIDFNPKTSRLFVDKEKDIQFMLDQAKKEIENGTTN